MYLNIDKKKISRSVLFFDMNDNFETLIKKDFLFKDFKSEMKYIESILDKERTIVSIKHHLDANRIYENPPKKSKGYDDALQPSLFDSQQSSENQNIESKYTKTPKKEIEALGIRHKQKDFEQMQMSFDFQPQKKNEYTIPKNNVIKLHCVNRVGKYLDWDFNDINKIVENKFNEWQKKTNETDKLVHLSIKSFFENELYDSLANAFTRKQVIRKSKYFRNLYIPKIYQMEQQFFTFPSDQFFMNIDDFYAQYDDLEIKNKPLDTKSKKRYAKKIKNEHESYEISNYTNAIERKYWLGIFKKIEKNYYGTKDFSTLKSIFHEFLSIAIKKQIGSEFSNLEHTLYDNRKLELTHTFYDKISNFIKQKEPIEMIKCTSGSFLANPYASKNLNEKPIYKEIKNDFWLSSEPVSELLWLAIMGVYPRYNDNNNGCSIYDIFHIDSLSANNAYLISSMNESKTWSDSDFVFSDSNSQSNIENCNMLLDNNQYSDFSKLNSPIRGLAPSLQGFEMMIIFCNRLSKLYGFKPYYKIKRKKHIFEFCADPKCETLDENIKPFTKPNCIELAQELEAKYITLNFDQLATKQFTLDSPFQDDSKFDSWPKIIKDKVTLSEMKEYTFEVEIDEDSNGFRLPLDIEWQYAASTHQNTCFSGFDELNKDLNPYSNTSIYQSNIGLDNLKIGTVFDIDNILSNQFSQTRSPNPSKIGIANSWGFKNMTGNIWEICVDSESYSKNKNFNTRSLVCKGGSFNSFFLNKDDVIKQNLQLLKTWNMIKNEPSLWPPSGIKVLQKSIDDEANSSIKMLIENANQYFDFFHYPIPCFANDISIDYSSKFISAIRESEVAKITPTQMSATSYFRRDNNLGVVRISEKQKKVEGENSKFFQNSKQCNKYLTSEWDSYNKIGLFGYKHIIDSLFVVNRKNISLSKKAIESEQTTLNPKFVGFRLARNIPKK